MEQQHQNTTRNRRSAAREFLARDFLDLGSVSELWQNQVTGQLPHVQDFYE